MKKKLFLMVVMTFVFALALTFAVSAESVHNENTVDYDATVTLDNGTVCNLFDSEKNALIWYLDNSGNLQSIKANDIEDGDDGKRVVYFVESGQTSLAKINIYSGDSIVGYNKNIVVFNIMDDTIAFDTDSSKDGIQPITSLMLAFDYINKANKGTMNLEYAYLRLDTKEIGAGAFLGCAKLKYVNLESLTELEVIGAINSHYSYGGAFRGCSSLFANQVLDLSKTKITTIAEGAPKSGVAGNFAMTSISGIKLPNTLTFIDNHAFYDCKKLTTVWFNSSPTIEYNAFIDATSLNQIYYPSSNEDFTLFIGRVSSSGNNPFWSVVNAKTISYSEYDALEDKNIKCAVYNYNSCAYNGLHGEVTVTNACVGVCTVCGDTVVSHADGNTTTAITYSNYSLAGVKTISCKNNGCGYSETVEAEALFVCHGYSAPENGRGGIAIGFTVNNDAIDEFTSVTGKTLLYGVFAVAKEKLGDNDILDKDGKEANGVINAEITGYKFSSFELKIVGFTDEYKDVKLAMGAYAKVTDGESTEYSYMQSGTPNQGEKYCFVSFNEIVNAPLSDSEVAQ